MKQIWPSYDHKILDPFFALGIRLRKNRVLYTKECIQYVFPVVKLVNMMICCWRKMGIASTWRRILRSFMCSHDIYDVWKNSIWLSAHNFKQLLPRITTIWYEDKARCSCKMYTPCKVKIISDYSSIFTRVKALRELLNIFDAYINCKLRKISFCNLSSVFSLPTIV